MCGTPYVGHDGDACSDIPEQMFVCVTVFILLLAVCMLPVCRKLSVCRILCVLCVCSWIMAYQHRYPRRDNRAKLDYLSMAGFAPRSLGLNRTKNQEVINRMLDDEVLRSQLQRDVVSPLPSTSVDLPYVDLTEPNQGFHYDGDSESDTGGETDLEDQQAAPDDASTEKGDGGKKAAGGKASGLGAAKSKTKSKGKSGVASKAARSSPPGRFVRKRSDNKHDKPRKSRNGRNPVGKDISRLLASQLADLGFDRQFSDNVSAAQQAPGHAGSSSNVTLNDLDTQLLVEQKRNQLLKLRRENVQLEQASATGSHDKHVSFSVAGRASDNNQNYDIDFRTATLDQLRSSDPLVRDVEEHMSGIGLFGQGDGHFGTQVDGQFGGTEAGKGHVSAQRTVCTDKLLSGADEIVTASIKSKLVWPQSKLKYNHANRKFKFLDLPSFQLLVAGEVACLMSDEMSQAERVARLRLLQESAYLSVKLPWEVVRDFHFNVMLGVERGERKWGDSTLDIQTAIMLTSGSSGVDRFSANAKGNFKKQEVGQSNRTRWWCLDFQKGNCNFSGAHEGTVRGVRRWVEHFCAQCFEKNRVIKFHRESEGSCPFGQSGSRWGGSGRQGPTAPGQYGGVNTPATWQAPPASNAWGHNPRA